VTNTILNYRNLAVKQHRKIIKKQGDYQQEHGRKYSVIWNVVSAMTCNICEDRIHERKLYSFQGINYTTFYWFGRKNSRIPDSLYHASFRVNVNYLTVPDNSIIVFFECKTLQINLAHHPYRWHPAAIYEQQKGGQSVSHNLIHYQFYFYHFLFFIYFRAYTTVILVKPRSQLHKKESFNGRYLNSLSSRMF
jgi:hypothetical protein